MRTLIILFSLALLSCNKCATFYYECTTTQHFAPYKTKKEEFTEDHCGEDYKEKKKQKDIYYTYDGDIKITYDGVPADVHVHLIKYK